MIALQQSLLSLAGQLALLMPAVAELEQQQARQTEAQQKALAIRMQKLKHARMHREQQYKAEILVDLCNHPGSKTNEIATRLVHERRFIFRLLREIESDGLVVRIGTEKILRWDVTK